MGSDSFVRFVVLTTQRSGSGWFIDQLNTHPAVVAYTEMFVERGDGVPRGAGRKDLEYFESYAAARTAGGDAGSREEMVRDYLDLLFAARPAVRAVGMKLMYGQAGAYPEILATLERRGVAPIHLVRRDLLAIVVSRHVAWQRDLWHARRGDEVPRATIRLDLRDLLTELDRLAREQHQWHDACARWPVRHLEVSYETLVASPHGFAPVLEFLGVDPSIELRSDFVRIITRPMRDVIANFDEVERTLRGTRYAPLIDSVGH